MTPDQARAAVLTVLRCNAWAMRPEALQALVAFAAGDATPTEAREHMALDGAAETGHAVRGGVAVVPLSGVITPAGSLFSFLFGGSPGGLAGFRAQLRGAVDDPDVSSVVIDVDSPGGLVDMVPETAAEIRALASSKPIVAVANTMAASAAYWLASQADELAVSPSGQVGSIGVYVVHRDLSAMQQQMGVATTMVSAGKFKTEGNPFEALSASAQAAMQQDVDDIYGLFTTDVATGRGATVAEIRDGYGQGRMVLAGRAGDAGMADSVETLDDVVSRLAGITVRPHTRTRPASAQDQARETRERLARLQVDLTA